VTISVVVGPRRCRRNYGKGGSRAQKQVFHGGISKVKRVANRIRMRTRNFTAGEMRATGGTCER
jgi:hypothetical protein